MKTLARSLFVLILLACGSLASAAIFTGNYSQDFNSMGTGTAAPAGWSVYSIAGSHDQFKPADDLVGTGALPTGNDIKGGTLQSTLKAETADTTTSQKASQAYNWAIGGSSTERALGSSPTGVAGMILQLVLTNNSGAAINHLGFDYDILVLSTTTNNNSYNNPPYVGKEELPGYELFYSLDGGATYTNVTALNPDGHTWANTIGTVHMSLADLTLGGTWNNGADLYLRWFDDNAQGPSPDQKIGLDNLTVVPEPASLSLLVIGGLAMLRRRKTALSAK